MCRTCAEHPAGIVAPGTCDNGTWITPYSTRRYNETVSRMMVGGIQIPSMRRDPANIWNKILSEREREVEAKKIQMQLLEYMHKMGETSTDRVDATL